MSEESPKLRVFFENKDPKETAECLLAIAAAAQSINGPVDVHIGEKPQPAPVSQARRPKTEQLETLARDAATKALEKNERASQRRAAGKPGKPTMQPVRRVLPSPKEIAKRRVEQRKTLLQLCKDCGLMKGITIVIVAGANWVADKIKNM
ncbi:MAG: hypothetical protein KF787_04600 [Phycisphaeraceae bacterium]|nr:hypothetical protein [Phycisphaerae bacterium]MBX3391908.1 hypothetical protein [Phycisphaeraceae bacterium]